MRHANIDRTIMTLVAICVVCLGSTVSVAIAQEYTFGQWASDTGLSPTATYAGAWDAGITSLDGLGSYAHLNVLELGGNPIIAIEPGDFDGLTNLNELWLNNCPLTTLQTDGFRGLDNLASLHFEYAQIDTIETGAFTGLNNLTTLWFEGQHIQSIAPGAFTGLSSLPSLDLGYFNSTGLTSPRDLDLSGLDSLTTLYFSGEFNTLETGDCEGMSGLEYVKLGNSITSIEPGALNGLTGTLELGSNPINFEPGVFAGMEDLRGLILFGQGRIDLTGADFSDLGLFDAGDGFGVDLVLSDSTLSQTAFDALVQGVGWGRYGVDLSLTDLTAVESLDLLRVGGHSGHPNYSLDLSNVQFSDFIIDSGYIEVIDAINRSADSARNYQGADIYDTIWFHLTVDEDLWASIGPHIDSWPGSVTVVPTVPEPMTMSLLAFGGVALLRRKEKRDETK